MICMLITGLLEERSDGDLFIDSHSEGLKDSHADIMLFFVVM